MGGGGGGATFFWPPPVYICQIHLVLIPKRLSTVDHVYVIKAENK